MSGQGGDGPSDHIQSGDPVEVQDLNGEWLPAVARSDVEMRHGFPVIWVALPDAKAPIPWHAEHVRHYPQPD